MLTTTKWTLAALSAVALVGVAAAATPQGQSTTASLRDGIAGHFRAFHRDPLAHIDRVCADDMAWGDCKALLHEKADEMHEARHQECLEERSQDSCGGRLDHAHAGHDAGHHADHHAGHDA